MEIIEAIWEKRNLDVDAVEVKIDSCDLSEDVIQQIEKVKGQYIVIKIDSNNSVMTEAVQNLGYRYIEDMITVEHDLHEVKRTPMHQRLYDATSFGKMDDNDYAELLEEVGSGLFENDRISRDSSFGQKKASIRYSNWLKDLRKEGAGFYKIVYKNETAGFVILQTKDGKEYTSVLGGGYEKFRKSGLGIIQKEQEIVKSLGGIVVKTQVSSSNAKQLRALILNGYVPRQIHHIFIKHMG